LKALFSDFSMMSTMFGAKTTLIRAPAGTKIVGRQRNAERQIVFHVHIDRTLHAWD